MQVILGEPVGDVADEVHVRSGEEAARAIDQLQHAEQAAFVRHRPEQHVLGDQAFAPSRSGSKSGASDMCARRALLCSSRAAREKMPWCSASAVPRRLSAPGPVAATKRISSVLMS